jgi:hypothetical protein
MDAAVLATVWTIRQLKPNQLDHAQPGTHALARPVRFSVLFPL